MIAIACASVASSDDAALLARARQLFKPLPADAATPERPLGKERVELGRALFFEPRLSLDDRISCATCHQPSFYGAEPLAVSMGPSGKLLPRNTPTIFNTALQFAQHYGGNRSDVEDQAVRSLTSPFAYQQRDVGSVAKLEDAVRIMAKLQLGRDLAPPDVADIVAFLESLTGEVPANFAEAPVLPVARPSR